MWAEHYRALDLGSTILYPTGVQARTAKVLSILVRFLKLLVVPTVLRPAESRSRVFCFAGEWTGLLFLLNWASGSVQLHISSVGTGSRAQSSPCHRASAPFPFIRAVAVKSPHTNSDFMSCITFTRTTTLNTEPSSAGWRLLYLRWCFLLRTALLNFHPITPPWISDSSHWQTFDGHYSFTKAHI